MLTEEVVSGEIFRVAARMRNQIEAGSHVSELVIERAWFVLGDALRRDLGGTERGGFQFSRPGRAGKVNARGLTPMSAGLETL